MKNDPKKFRRVKRSKPKQTDAQVAKLLALAESGMSSTQIAGELGVEARAVRHVIERERIRREAMAEPEITPEMLSKSAQEKLDAAVRQHRRHLDLQFEMRLRDEIYRRINEIILPHHRQQIEQAKQLYDRRKALMDKETFNTIRRALHPDSRHGISDSKLGEAFDAFMALEKYLLNEKDSPTDLGALPSSAAEWDKMRAKQTLKRRRTPFANVTVRTR